MAIELTTTEKITCKNCGSTAVVKFGSYNGVPRYWCKVCGRKFKVDDAVFGRKYPAMYATTAISMYQSGATIRAIRKHIKDNYGCYLSTNTIFRWVH